MSSNMQCFTTYYKTAYMIEPWFLDSFKQLTDTVNHF